MLIEEFSFGNFKSFKDIQTLRMSAAKIKSKNQLLDNQNVFTVNNTQFLKSKVIYGANASGKSNAINALVYFLVIIFNNLRDEDTLKKYIYPFIYSTETEKEPSFFQLIFHVGDKRYRYGFEATQEKIYSEWLYMTHNVREVPVFVRDGQNIIQISKTHIPQGDEISKLKFKLFTEKVLFLTLIESFGDKLAESLFKSIRLHATQNNTDAIADRLKNENELTEVVSFLKYADTGINSIKLAKGKVDKAEDEEKTIVLSCARAS